MAITWSEGRHEIGGAAVTLRHLLDEDRALVNDLMRRSGVRTYFDWDEIRQYTPTVLIVEWCGETRWTAAFSGTTAATPTVVPLLWRAHAWAVIAFGFRVFGLSTADGSLAWSLGPDSIGWPVTALAVDEDGDMLFVAPEIEVIAVEAGITVAWEYSHDEPIVGMTWEAGLLDLEQWDGVHVWLDARTGERVR